jgi:hypothetical protein
MHASKKNAIILYIVSMDTDTAVNTINYAVSTINGVFRVLLAREMLEDLATDQ